MRRGNFGDFKDRSVNHGFIFLQKQENTGHGTYRF